MSQSEQIVAVDWSAEPATTREKHIRAAVLRNALRDSPGGFLRLTELLYTSANGDMSFRLSQAASDFRAVWNEASAADEQRRHRRNREIIAAAIREVDGDETPSSS